MDSIKPQEIVSNLIEIGAKKSKLSAKDILIRSILSGSLLGFATVLAFLTTIQSGSGVLGALAFPVGFAIIVILGFELVTGNFAIIPMAVMAKETKMKNLAHNWFFATLGNLIGSLLFGGLFFIYITKMGKTFDLDIIDKIISIAESKTLAYKELGNKGFIVVFVKAVLCNWMVTLGIVMGYVSTSTIGRIVALWLPIFIFFALGLEHCVVNMFVIPTSILFNANITIGDWWIWNQIPAIIGNIVGGFVFTGLFLYLTYYKKENAAQSNKPVLEQPINHK
ncbi:MAG: putative formate transporter 1 [Flavobacteriales bacterium]|nr:putative formate transporter 1 [Flavobacteriales bacterium]